MESNQDKDELNLQLVGGTAKVSNKDIVYNYNKGYYEVRVQAGLFNPTSQEIKDKWVAFALPEGVYLANENVPSGVEFVKVNGHNGIAVKIPNVGPYGHKSIFPIIPLKIDPNVAEGKVEDRNPYYTLHLYEYDPASDSFYDLGELGNQREIDFTQFEATPVLDITSRINGNATFDKEKHHYVLDVTIETTNHSAIKTDNVYLGIPLPDTVGVLKTSEHDGTYFALDSVKLL